MTPELIEKLKKLATQECWSDELNHDGVDACVVDFSGDNVDDAFEGGYRAGEVMLARDILATLNISVLI